MIVGLITVVLFTYPIAQGKFIQRTPATGETLHKGAQLLAFMAAYDRFQKLKELTKKQRDLKNYDVFMYENNKEYSFSFAPLVSKDDPPAIEWKTPRGMFFVAVVSKTTGKLLRLEVQY